MEWSIGHSLIVVLALLLGLAAGWLLRGRQDARASGQGRSIVDDDPVAGLAVIDAPVPPAATDEAAPVASLDAPPAAVADEPAPVDTVSAPAAVTTPDDSAPDAVDTGDMALTEAPPPVPATERTDAVDDAPAFAADPEPVAADEQPATVIAPRQPMDDSADTLPAETTPAETTPAEDTPAEDTPAADTQAESSPAKATSAETDLAADTQAADTQVETSPAETTYAEAIPVETSPAEAPEVEAPYTEVTPVEATPVVATAATSADAADAEPVRAAPPVRVADTTPPQADTEPTAPADDFRRIQGVGPKMAAALQAAGVRTYAQLGELDEPALRDLIRAAGLRAAPALATWPQQARVLAGAGDQVTAVLPGGSQG
ncbi:hypothetical protein [Micromonospora lupini]|uniref:hypothetical protein n=1 Tax=Micromonospora lupini TaxID=285679 RepID=UPI003378E6B3